MSRQDPKPGSIMMARHITAVVCEHGHLYIRLHNGKGDIFAAACMTKPVGFGLIDQILAEFSKPTAECEGLHS
jgi:hypothetical protein